MNTTLTILCLIFSAQFALAEEAKRSNTTDLDVTLFEEGVPAQKAPPAFSPVSRPRAKFPVTAGKPFHFENPHTGRLVTNISGRLGTAITALWDGEVISKSPDINQNGNSIRIKHTNGLISTYLFMGKPTKLNVGDKVRRGQKVSVMGISGFTRINKSKQPLLYVGLSTEDGQQLYALPYLQDLGSLNKR